MRSIHGLERIHEVGRNIIQLSDEPHKYKVIPSPEGSTRAVDKEANIDCRYTSYRSVWESSVPMTMVRILNISIRCSHTPTRERTEVSIPQNIGNDE